VNDNELVYRIMQTLAGPPGADEDVMAEAGEELFLWRNDDGTVKIMANLNDTFYYACGDSEPITADNLPVFEQSVRDVVRLGIDGRWGLLFAVRVRRRLPLRPVYEAQSPEFRALMDEAIA